MPSYVIPEEVTGVPLFVPEANDFFSIEDGGLPNGDPCLVVHGDVSNNYKAYQLAPTLSKDIFHLREGSLTGGWAMTCWLKLSNLSVPANGRPMFGCSNSVASGGFTYGRNNNIKFLVGTRNTNGIAVTLQPGNDVVSPSSAMNCYIYNNSAWNAVSGQWHLFTMNVYPSGGFYGGLTAVFLNDSNSSVSDSYGIGLGGGISATQYLHIGPYSNNYVGRADEWRMAKWAFHDHPLNQTERTLLYDTMMGL